MKNGVLYIVSHDKEILAECIHSAASVKQHHPDLPIQVITDAPSEKFGSQYFDFVDVRREQLHPLKAKVKYLRESRFQNTLFLDADTEVRKPIIDLFKDHRINLSIAFDNLCDWKSSPVRFIAQHSEDFNTGFLLYDSSPAIKTLLLKWYETVSVQDESDMRPGHNCDQVYFNRHFGKMLKETTALKIRILQNELYNVRPWCWQSLKEKGTFQNIKVAHAHHLHHSFFRKARRKLAALLTS